MKDTNTIHLDILRGIPPIVKDMIAPFQYDVVQSPGWSMSFRSALATGNRVTGSRMLYPHPHNSKFLALLAFVVVRLHTASEKVEFIVSIDGLGPIIH